MIHLHMGSQGCSINLLCKGIKRIMNLIKKINKNEKIIKYIDIGGGKPIDVIKFKF
jgi:arginine decarboxylase-like protein